MIHCRLSTDAARKRLKDPEFLAMCLECHFDMALQRIVRQPEAERAHARAALLEQFKLAVHNALRKSRVQEHDSTHTMLRRLLAVQQERVEVQVAGSEDIACAIMLA